MAKEMIRRKDGSYSQRGLWDNIRANKGSGKKPTSQMLKQEKKIKMATIKKAQKGTRTPMQIYKSQYPSADTTIRGDYRFDELPAGIPAAARKKDEAMRKAYDAKYGKGKPATAPKKKAKKAQLGASVKPQPMSSSKNKSSVGASAFKAAKKISKYQLGGQIKSALTNRPVKTKTKQKIDGGNYIMKTVEKKYSKPETYGTKTKVKTRRTFKGIANKVSPGLSIKSKNINKRSKRVGVLQSQKGSSIGKAFLGIGIGKDARMARRADRQARMQSKENVRRSNRNVCKMNRMY